MSDRVGIKAKDNVGKKFSSLNLNQTYKGTKVEPKANPGVSRHGLQSLGKVAASRRMPPPANLPSLKSENLGNDPTVALVPSGGGGWGSGKEKETTTTTTAAVPGQTSAPGTTSTHQQQTQQQLKPSETSQRPKTTTGQQPSTGQTTTNQTSGTSTKTWASSSSVAGGQEKTSYPHQSQYFNREFPTLGGGNSGDKQLEERVSHPPYGQPPRNMHDPPWMDKGGSGPPPKPSFGMYNGAPYGPPQRGGYDSQSYHRDGHPPNNYSRPEGTGTFPYMGQSRPANYSAHPAAQRGHPGPKHGGPAGRNLVKLEDSPSGYARPSILNEDDIKAMDAEDLDDGGWAGAQEEIDYSVKLNFDDDEPPSPVGEKNGQDREMEQKSDVSKHENQTAHHNENKPQDANKARPVPRPAWSGPGRADDYGNYQQQHYDTSKQGPYPSQTAWGNHHLQQRNAFSPGPISGYPPPSGLHQDGRRMEHRGPEGHGRPRLSERSTSIEQARQRKEQEEQERKRQQEAAAQEKLRALDARNRQLHVQTHDTSSKEQTGPRSPVSPAGSDAPVRRIMRRKDSGGTGEDDGSSVKSVESVGKEEKKENIRGETLVKDSKEQLRKTSSELQEERKSRLKDLREERKAPEIAKQAKEKIDEKTPVERDVRKVSSEKEAHFQASKPPSDGEAKRVKSVDDSTDGRSKPERKENQSLLANQWDTRKTNVSHDQRGEVADRKGNENRRREESNRKKEHFDSKKELQERQKDESDRRKESMDKKNDYSGSKNERGSSESLRSRESLDKKDDRKRNEDAIKRKRDDFERNESYEQRGNRERGHNRERLYSGSRGRATLGGKSSLRGHPKSYSHGRADRASGQRRITQRTRRDSGSFADEETKIPPEEKRHVNDKVEERRQAEGAKRQPEVERRQRDGSRRRDDQYQDSRSFGGNNRNERQSKEDRPFRGSGRFPSRPAPDQRSTDRGSKFRDKPRYRGGFGVPPRKPSEETKEDQSKGRSDEKQKPQNQPREGGIETNSSLSSFAEPSKAKQEANTSGGERDTDHGRVDRQKKTSQQNARNNFVPPVTNAWDTPEEPKESAKEVKNIVNENQSSEYQVGSDVSGDYKTASATSREVGRERKPIGKEEVDKQSSQKRDFVSQRDRLDSRHQGKASSKETKVSERDATKTDEQRRQRTEPQTGDRRGQSGDRREQGVEQRKQSENRREQRADRRDLGVDHKEQTGDRRGQETKHNRGVSKNDFHDSKGEEKQRRDNVPRGDNRRKQEPRFEDRRPRTTPREQESKGSERRSRTEPRTDSYREQGTKSEKRGDRAGPRAEFRRDAERNMEERRDGTVPRDTRYRPESKSDDRRDRKGPRDRTEQRDRTEPCDRTGPPGGSKSEQEVKLEEKQDSKVEERSDQTEQSKDIQNEQGTTTSKWKERFTIGSTSSEKQGTGRGRYKESRRGGSVSRRGARNLPRPVGRGRGRSFDNGRISGRTSSVSKDDDDSDESDKFHSAASSVDGDSVESDTEVFCKPDQGYKDERGSRSHPTGGGGGGGGVRQSFGGARTRGRGRGTSPPSSRPRKHVERPPRFQKQDQAKGASRGRGKGGRGQHGGFPTKENLDDKDSGQNYEKTAKNFEDGPSPKKRPAGDSVYSGEKSSSGGIKSKKSGRGNQGTKSSFLVKKQQEVIEGSRKGGLRSSAGPKSTIPAALSTHGRIERRGKNKDSAPDVDDIPEPPKKNPRRAEPQRMMGLDHIDLSNIAGFIDIDDIAQPASETEPASPHSGFVEVKSKRTQKELRERAREEEERRRRETEKMMADAMMKPKFKQNNLNKSHQTSKPPRFARNVTSTQVPTVTRVPTPPETVQNTVNQESSVVCGVPPGDSDSKRTSPLMMEKPSSPAPPPIFNAWTKPLSITPAKPPNASVEMSTANRPDPLAVGSGKPTRPNTTQPKSEEPELRLQVTLPDTFQALPTERNMDSQSTETPTLIEDSEIKKRSVESDANKEQKTDGKVVPQAPVDQGVVNNEKITQINEKRQTNNRFTKPPRFEKGPAAKRSVDGRKHKDVKDQSCMTETKSHPSNGEMKVPKEKTDNRPRSASRPRDLNKKPKPQVKATKLEDDSEGHPHEKNSRENEKNGKEDRQNLNKRDSAELDVQSMSESLLNEAPLGDVRIVETGDSPPENRSMDKIKTEDDIKMDDQMKEKMVAAKKAWDDSISSSAVTIAVTSQNWKKSSVSDEDSAKSKETSVMDQIPRPSNEMDESAEPLASPSARLKKPAGEQQNVCKVKPQQQQQPVKPQVSSDVTEEFSTSSGVSRPRMDLQPQASFPVQQTTVFSSKPTPQYSLPLDQTLLTFSAHQYMQGGNITTVQHTSPVRPQALHPTSQSPPQRSAAFPQVQPISTPSPLSQQPVLQDTYRPVMQGALYSTTSYPTNQYFTNLVVRPTAPHAQFQTPVDEVSSSVYSLQPPKTQTPGHGYEQAVAAGQQVYIPVEQQFVDHAQSQRQHGLGYYTDNTNQTNMTGNISLVQPSVSFIQTDERMQRQQKQQQQQQQQQTQHGHQQHSRDSHVGHHEQQIYSNSGKSEMVKHVNAKPFQPPTNPSSATNVAHQVVVTSRHITAVPGPTSGSPAYQINSAVMSRQPAGAVQSSSSASTHSGTSAVVTQAQSLTVPRFSMQFPGAVGSYQRHQVPVQALSQQPYPTGLTYRTPVAGYPPSSVSNPTAMLVQKSYPVVRQMMPATRGAHLSHRVPEPIQRPSKPGMISSNPKEKLANQPVRPKAVPQSFGRRNLVPYQFQQPQRPQHQQQQQQQQQQTFRNQQHQIMLSGVHQFFAEELQHQRKSTQDQKRELPSVAMNGGDGSQQTINQDKRKQQLKNQQETKLETKPQKSTKKDEQKKPEYKHEKRNTRPPDRKEVRTAQIQPQRSQVRSQHRPRCSVPKQETAKTIEQVSVVDAAKTEQKSVEKIESRTELKESLPEVPTPLVS